MLPTRAAHAAAIDEEASFYLDRIKQIDRIVEGPVKTLIGLTQTRGPDDGSQTNGPLYFPTWISAELKPQHEDNRLTHSICCSTLQRVRRFRRRFSWLGKTPEQQLRGGLSPLTASRIFRVLLEHSEASPHVVKNEGRTRPEVQEA